MSFLYTCCHVQSMIDSLGTSVLKELLQCASNLMSSGELHSEFFGKLQALHCRNGDLDTKAICSPNKNWILSLQIYCKIRKRLVRLFQLAFDKNYHNLDNWNSSCLLCWPHLRKFEIQKRFARLQSCLLFEWFPAFSIQNHILLPDNVLHRPFLSLIPTS